MRLAFALVLAAAPAYAEPMTAASDDVCALLRADRHDRCRKLGHDGDATAYQSGTGELRRFVLAIARAGDDTLVSPSFDVHGNSDAQLAATMASLRTIHLDGRPVAVLDVISVFRADPVAFQTESFVGCGQANDGGWRCSVVDVGRCSATLDDSGNITGCDHALRVTLAR
jgi:hypothetical protein